MSEIAVGTDQAPTGPEVGNHHWPEVSNYFDEHGGQFLPHHDHRDEAGTLLALSELKKVHRVPLAVHDETANYHQPKQEPGCRGHRAGYL